MRVVVIVGLLLFLLAQPAVSQVPDDKLIVPGQRIGKWTLDLTIDDLLRMNGPRNGVSSVPYLQALQLARVTRNGDAPDDSWVHRWSNLGMTAMTIGRESQKVVELAVLSDEYGTDKGVRVGMSNEAVLRAYGSPTVAIAPQTVHEGQATPLCTEVYDQIGLAIMLGLPPGSGEAGSSRRTVAPGHWCERTEIYVIQYVSVFRPGTAKQSHKF